MLCNLNVNRFKWLFAIAAIGSLLACASQQPTPNFELSVSPGYTSGNVPAWMLSSNWRHQSFPGKRQTRYFSQHQMGREALAARSDRSMSVMRNNRRIEAVEIGTIKFSWLARELIAEADLGQRDADDAKLRIILVFERDRSQFSAKNQALADLTTVLTGEELPYATLMYVWSHRDPVGSVIHNPRTDRIRKLVVESGTANLGKWLDYQRDIRADYIRVWRSARRTHWYGADDGY
jgi:hypothetical protein